MSKWIQFSVDLNVSKKEIKAIKERYAEKKNEGGINMRKFRFSPAPHVAPVGKTAQRVSAEIEMDDESQCKELIEEVSSWVPPIDGSFDIVGIRVDDVDA